MWVPPARTTGFVPVAWAVFCAWLCLCLSLLLLLLLSYCSFKESLELHKVARVMVNEVTSVQLRSTGADVARLLSTTAFNGFPVVERVDLGNGKVSDKFVGMVMRPHLERMVLALMAYVRCCCCCTLRVGRLAARCCIA